MGKIEPISPVEVYGDTLPEVPDAIIEKVNHLLVEGRRDDITLPIKINVSTIEDLILETEGVAKGSATQELIYAILLQYNGLWEITHENGSIHFTPSIHDDGKHKIRALKTT